jgi:hypothetical protein
MHSTVHILRVDGREILKISIQIAQTHFLWNPKIYYCPPSVPLEPDQFSPRPTSYLLMIHFNIILPLLSRFPSGLSRSVFPSKPSPLPGFCSLLYCTVLCCTSTVLNCMLLLKCVKLWGRRQTYTKYM